MVLFGNSAEVHQVAFSPLRLEQQTNDLIRDAGAFSAKAVKGTWRVVAEPGLKRWRLIGD